MFVYEYTCVMSFRVCHPHTRFQGLGLEGAHMFNSLLLAGTTPLASRFLWPHDIPSTHEPDAFIHAPSCNPACISSCLPLCL